MRLYAGRFQNQAPQTWQSKYGNPAGSVLDLRQTLVRRLVVPVIFLAITNGLFFIYSIYFHKDEEAMPQGLKSRDLDPLLDDLKDRLRF